MQPTRTLQDIIASLNSVYQPQVDLYRQQQSQIPQQAQAQEDALGAKKDQAFGDILSGARQRGLGFSGIPLGEQAKYVSTDYLPAVANLRTASTNQATSLEQAILQLQQQQNTQAQDIYQTEQNRAEQARQFDMQQRAAAQAATSYRNLFGGGQSSPSAPTAPQTDPLKQQATAALFSLFGTNDQGLIRKTIDAIKKSAGYGNTYDQMKLQIIQTLHPEYLQPVKSAPAPAKAAPVNHANVTGNGQVFKPSVIGIR